MLSVLAQTAPDFDTGPSYGAFFLWYVLWLVLYAVGAWRMYEKAGQPGWAAIIPIYNFIVLMKIIGRPWWWILLVLIPIVNIVILIIVWNDLSKSFSHGVGFTIGLIFLSVIFILILGLGNSQYRGPAAGGGTAAAPPPPPPPPPVPA